MERRRVTFIRARRKVFHNINGMVESHNTQTNGKYTEHEMFFFIFDHKHFLSIHRGNQNL